jgi:hypothetical protein
LPPAAPLAHPPIAYAESVGDIHGASAVVQHQNGLGPLNETSGRSPLVHDFLKSTTFLIADLDLHARSTLDPGSSFPSPDKKPERTFGLLY